MLLVKDKRGRNVFMEVKRSKEIFKFLPTLTYGSQTLTWNRVYQLKMCAVKMRYQRGACGLTRWEDESNESV